MPKISFDINEELGNRSGRTTKHYINKKTCHVKVKKSHSLTPNNDFQSHNVFSLRLAHYDLKLMAHSNDPHQQDFEHLLVEYHRYHAFHHHEYL
ncbi:hypothetical protein Scep_011385 [Stephania cephalantha]|uniref:Uncharacterized protein n=1 Tax=Stephania cephalantha TaxID=152367 RepID=A0AAP0P5I3_9MAGN